MAVILDDDDAAGDPVWTPIRDGVDFLMRPATAADHAAATAAAGDSLNKAMTGAAALAELGLPALSAEDIGDAWTMLGYARALTATELAMRIVSDWRGVHANRKGDPRPLDRRAMAQLLRDPLMHNAFEAEAYRRIGALADEGKGSPLPPNGSPAVAAGTARAAPKTASRARPAGRGGTGRSARSSKAGR